MIGASGLRGALMRALGREATGIHSDPVVAGQEGPYDEEVEQRPLSVYGEIEYLPLATLGQDTVL